MAASGGGLDFSDLGGQAAPPADPRQLVRSVIQAGGWALNEDGPLWRVTVPVGPLRKQVVTIRFDRQDEGGHAMISYSSPCGPFTEQLAPRLLEYNTRLLHGAFAVEKGNGGPMVVMQANHLADAADPLEVTRVITAVAWQADKVEERLVGEDTY